MRLATPDLQNPSVPAYYYCRHNKHHCAVFAVRLSVRFATSSPVLSRNENIPAKLWKVGWTRKRGEGRLLYRPRRRLLKGKETYAAAQRGTEIIHQFVMHIQSKTHMLSAKKKINPIRKSE